MMVSMKAGELERICWLNSRDRGELGEEVDGVDHKPPCLLPIVAGVHDLSGFLELMKSISLFHLYHANPVPKNSSVPGE